MTLVWVQEITLGVKTIIQILCTKYFTARLFIYKSSTLGVHFFKLREACIFSLLSYSFFFFKMSSLCFADVVVRGIGAPDGAGVEGDKVDALKLFTFSCLYFAYVVVRGFDALKLLFF